MDRSSTDLVHRFPHEAMGTLYEVMIAGPDEAYSREAAGAAFQEIGRLERLFSRFDASSEISQINRLEPGATLRIGWETYECLAAAERVRSETGGAFDINFRARAARLKPGCPPAGDRKDVLDREAGSHTDSADIIQAEASSRPAYELFPVPGGFAIRVLQRTDEEGDAGVRGARGVDLDLGAIGKGCALDRAAAILEEWSVENYLMHAGTSTALARGSAPVSRPSGAESGWPVGVGGTWELPGLEKRVLLRNRALSGSGTEVKGPHIKVPATGEPAACHLAAWASHPRAGEADALSTAFMVMSTDGVARYCRDRAGVWALVIAPDGLGRVFNPDILTG
jgi:thiamine biosynthesis lipoprotein